MKNIRKCQACGILKQKEDLIKITKLQNSILKINPQSNELGRSVYVCKNAECIKIFIKKKKIVSSLKCSNFEEIKKIETELLKLIEIFNEACLKT